MLKRIRPKRKEKFGINDRDGQKWITQLRVRLSHLNAHKFHHYFEDTLTSMCNILDGIDDTCHFLPHCRQFSSNCIDLFHNLSLILSNNVNVIPDNSLVHILLYGKETLSHKVNKEILLNAIDFIRKCNHLWIRCASPPHTTPIHTHGFSPIPYEERTSLLYISAILCHNMILMECGFIIISYGRKT